MLKKIGMKSSNLPFNACCVAILIALCVAISGCTDNSAQNSAQTDAVAIRPSTEEPIVAPVPTSTPKPTPTPSRSEKRKMEREARKQAAREKEKEEREEKERAKEEARAQRAKGVEGSLAYKLATIDNGYVDTNDRSVKRFNSLLEQLTSKYAEDDQKISDATVHTRDLLSDAGITQNCESIMEDLNRALPAPLLAENGENNQRYVEYAALYVTQRQSGSSRDEVVDAIRALTGG